MIWVQSGTIAAESKKKPVHGTQIEEDALVTIVCGGLVRKIGSV